MNAPLRVSHPLPFELGQVPPWSEEAERAILGAAMLGEPMPPWLEPQMFHSTQHRYVFETAHLVGGNVALVAARMREEGRLWTREMSPDRHGKPDMLSSVDLAQMCEEASFGMQMGWSWTLEAAELVRELWRRRELMTLLARLQIRLRAGDVGHEEARRELRAHFKEVR